MREPINLQPYGRIGLIGDVHSEDQALAQCLAFLQEKELDALLCTGDIADGHGDINRCCDLLQAHQVQVVSGNHDRWLLTDKVRHVEHAHRLPQLHDKHVEYLRSLPRSLDFNTLAGPAMLCHGIAHNDLAKIWPGTSRMPAERSELLDDILAKQNYRFIFNGHMHYRTLVYFDALTLLNAGTLRARHKPGFCIVDFGEHQVSAYEFEQDQCVVVGDFSLLPNASDKVWANSAAFDGQWQPKVLYADL